MTQWPASARADEAGPELRWDERVPRFRPVEYALTGVVGLAAIAEYTWLPAQSQPHRVGGILFDDTVRDALRARSPDALRTVWTLADVTGVAETVIVVGVDSAIAPVARASSDTAWQVTWFDLYGSRLLDALACARDVTLATADGVLRIRGDRHYTTDVLAGAALGFSFGYGLPWLLHYRLRGIRTLPSVTLAPTVGDPTGLVATGTF